MAKEFTVNGYVGVLDDADVDLLDFTWYVASSKNGEIKYFARNAPRSEGTPRQKILMHRVILSRVLGRELMRSDDVDHIDTDGLNNIRANLRLATRTQNKQNGRRHKDSKTGFKGVTWRKDAKRFQAQIQVNGKKQHLGLFDTAELAHAAYLEAAKQHFGEFVRGR